MTSLNPETEYPVEPSEWGLPAVSNFPMIGDIDSETGHFAILSSSKLKVVSLTLSKTQLF